MSGVFSTIIKSNHIYLAAADNEKIYVDVEKNFSASYKGLVYTLLNF